MVKAKSTKKSVPQWPRAYARKITTIHFGYVLAHIGLVITYDSWNLLTKESINQRWTLLSVLLGLNALVWFLARLSTTHVNVYKAAIATLIVYDIALAAMYVYWERGMASLSVALFMVPIVMAVGERSRGIIISTAIISAAAYSTAVVRYFNDNYGEGFRVQLYGTVVFYGAIFLFLAWMLIAVMRTPKREH